MSSRNLVGLTIDSFRGIRPSVFLHQISRIGVEFAEVTINIFDDRDLENIKASVNGIKIGLHLPIISDHGFDFSCKDKREKINQIIDRINRNWRDLNLLYVLSHPPEKHFVRPTGEVSEQFLFDNLNKIEAPIIFENTIENDAFRFEDFLVRAEQKMGPHLSGICFDGPHAYISRKNWFEMLETQIEKIRLVHLSDCTKEKDLHIPFGGEGELPVEKILTFLKDHKYKGIINLEIRPKSLTELGPVFKSYLLILKYLNRKKYFFMGLRSFFLLPVIQKRFR